jgi:hypothetical protein
MTETPSVAERTRSKNKAIGPEGYPISLSNLPSPKTERWVARRKAEILAAVKNGILSADEACRQYRISPEELDAWSAAESRFGLTGLRTLFRAHPRSKTPGKTGPSPFHNAHA